MRIRAFLLHVKTMMFSCDWFKKFDHIWNNLQWSALITSFISLECAKYNSPVFSYRDKKANLEGYKIGFTPVAIMLDPAHRSPLFDSFLILIHKNSSKTSHSECIYCTKLFVWRSRNNIFFVNNPRNLRYWRIKGGTIMPLNRFYCWINFSK